VTPRFPGTHYGNTRGPRANWGIHGRHCFHCGARAPVGERTCLKSVCKAAERLRKRGYKQTEMEAARRRCRVCGKQIEPGARWCEVHQYRKAPCPICGGRVRKSENGKGIHCSRPCKRTADARRRRVLEGVAVAAPALEASASDPISDLETYLARKQSGLTVKPAAGEP